MWKIFFDSSFTLVVVRWWWRTLRWMSLLLYCWCLQIYGGLGIWRLLIVGGLDHIGFIQFSNVRDEEVLVNSTPFITNYEGMEVNSSSIRGWDNWILQEKRSSPKRHSQEKEQKKLDTKMTIRKHSKNTTTKTCKRKQVVSTASRTIISWRNNDSHAKSMQIRSWNAHARRRK